MRVVLAGTGVYAIPPTGYGGVERTIDELGRALTRAGATVSVVNVVRRGRSIDEYWFARELPRLLRDRPYDILHASTPAVANRLAFSGLPYVYTTHSRHWFLRSGLRQRWGFYLERRAVARSRATIALTERLRRQIVASVGGRLPAPSRVIPIGVDTERFRPEPARRTGDRALGVGVVARIKRWEVAARAAGEAGAQLTILGPVQDRSYAEELRAIGPHVHLEGEVPDARLREAFGESDVLLHPSRVELLAGVVLQGLAAGLPVVGADPVADLLRAGTTGFAAPPELSDAELTRFFAGSVRQLLSDRALREGMGRAARREAEERFSWPVVARAHLELYRELAPNAGTG